MYSIGEFSTITQLTVKTLRFYHQKELLVPSVIDADSGYRYYSQRDIETALLIVTLKSYAFSLDEIHSILRDMSDDADIIDVIKHKKTAIDANIKQLKSVSSALHTIINKEREASKVNKCTQQIEIKQLDEVLVVSTRWQGVYADTGKAMGKIYRAGGRHSAGPALNLCYDGEHREIADLESCLPIKKAIKTDLDCKTLPGGKFVSLVHQGPYEKLGESYKRVIDYLKANQLEMILPTREVYIKGPGMIFKGNPDKYLTEILIPVA